MQDRSLSSKSAVFSPETVIMTEHENDDYDSLEIYRDYLMMIARWMMGLSYRGKFDADEIVNQTLFEAYQQLESHHGSSEAERIAWLKRILTNRINDAIRFLHRDKRDINKEQPLVTREWDRSCSSLMSLTCDWTSPSLVAVRHEQQLQLASALAELPDNQRTAIEFQFMHECSTREIAEAMDCSIAAVGGLLRRGLKTLKEKLNAGN